MAKKIINMAKACNQYETGVCESLIKKSKKNLAKPSGRAMAEASQQ